MFALVLGAFPIGVSVSQAQDACVVGGAKLANCSSEARILRSVLIAIPGWTGVCETSFGEGEHNLLNAIRRVNFFDVDCFDFDSHNTPFDVIRTELMDRIERLNDLGYTQFALVTHSTGGIIASDLIQSQIFGGEDGGIATGEARGDIFRTNGPRLRGLYTWAVPLNGLNPTVDFAQTIANLFRISPALLPQMSPNAAYLKNLQRRWREFADARAVLPAAERATYTFPWLILQGQGLDGVVNPISPNDTWFPTGVVKLVETEAFHTDVVSDAGTQDVPKYPGEVMTNELLLSLPFLPRYEELFSSQTPNDEASKRKQRAVLAAVLGLAHYYNGFPDVSGHITDFIVQLLTGQYPHDGAFDVEAIEELTGLLDEVIALQGNRVVVAFGDDLVSAIATSFPEGYSLAPETFGAGRYEAVRVLVAGLDRVFKRVVELTDADGSLVTSLRSSRTRAEFDRRYIIVSQRLLTVQDDPTRQATIAALQANEPSIDAGVLLESGIVQSLAAYAAVAQPRPELGQLLLQIQQRSPELNIEVMKQSLPRTDNSRASGPWSRLFTDDQAIQLIDTAAEFGGAEEIRASLLSDMIARGSVAGSSARLGTIALEQYDSLLAAGAANRVEAAGQLSIGLRETRFPVIEQRGNELLRANGFSR